MSGEFNTDDWESFVEYLESRTRSPAFTLLRREERRCYVMPSELIRVDKGEDGQINLIVFVGSLLPATKFQLFIFSPEDLDENALDRIISSVAPQLSCVENVTRPFIFLGWKLGTPFGV